MVRKIIPVCFLSIFLCESIFASQIRPSQDPGSTIRDYIDKKKREETIERITKPKLPSLDEVEIEALPGKKASVSISKIIIQQDVLAKEYVKEHELQRLIEGYENRTLSLEDMQTLASAITQELTHKKLKAYIPKQTFVKGIMYINLISEKSH